MRRVFPILGSAVFLVIAPGVVAGYVPWLISRWKINPPILGISAFRVVGVCLIAAGIPVLLDSFARFALQGLGTPAPIYPTQHLVVSGWYRYVRNPMYVAVAATILGQGLLFGNLHILEYGLMAWAVASVFVLLYEEPVLRKSFGVDYEEYCANVPRWIPRLRAWRPAAEHERSYRARLCENVRHSHIMKRPLSVTILGWVYILVGIGGLAYHLREFNPHHLFENDVLTASVVRALAIVAGIFMLQGKNWARWLALAWIAFHVIISIQHPLPQLVTHAVLLAVIAYLLFRPKAREYFGAVLPTTNNAQSS